MATDQRDDGLDNPNSTKPYLIRAIHEWSLDNGYTPQILVVADGDEVAVPLQHVKDNQIVLNIHPQSVRNLELGNDYLLCSARFSGKAFEIVVPVQYVLAIYARENGQGIVFQDEQNNNSPDPADPSSPTKKNKKPQPTSKKPESIQTAGSHLKLVK